MAINPPEYLPLGGKARAAFSVASAASYRLFLGPDHLLYVCNEHFAESYKRFYFQDIQALVLSETSRRKTLNIFHLVLMAGVLFLSLAIGFAAGAPVGWWMAGLCAPVFGTLIVVNTALGPTCICHVTTAVDRYLVTSLKRVRTAQAVFERIRPLIVAAQGALTLEEATTKPAQRFSLPMPAPPTAKPVAPRLRHESGYYHAALFSVLLIDCALTILDFLVKDLVVTVLSTFMVFIAIGLLVAALIRQQHSDVGKPLQLAVWATLAYLGLTLGLGYVYFIVTSIGTPGLQSDQWEWIKRFSEESPMDSPLLLISYIISIVGSFILGIAGLLAVRNHWRTTPRSGSASPTSV